MAQETLKQVGAAAAQQNAMERGARFLAHGTRLFTVSSGWESKMIREDRGVPSCETMLELEAAMRDENVRVIFIPADALMTDADIEKISERNGVTKTLFKEVKT
ncbi:MAG TPA: hypothetical protein PLW48_06515 [Alphaproteobacteria bacterium]|nr:hypothetical protein [Alphaproteobacteria bacterium]HCS22580.1 hypothetical protein [Rhodospirillaceae bacterium]HRI77288.1 hypothetical protein [Alphaproteobacteria bacterium]HRJ66774.1 hypothetical protein [Alphaproteobacteria bacterium]